MSRFEHQFFRKSEVAYTPRPVRTNSGALRLRVEKGETKPTVVEKYPWWSSRFADLVDRRNPDGTHRPRTKPVIKPIAIPRERPEMLPRLSEMTRQTQRRLFRQACKTAGVPYRQS